MACNSAAWHSGQERRLNDGRDRKASGSTLFEALLLVASSDEMLYDDKSSLLDRSFEQKISEVRLQPKTSTRRQLLSESVFIFWNTISSITVSCLRSWLSGHGTWTEVQRLCIWFFRGSSRITTDSHTSDVVVENWKETWQRRRLWFIFLRSA